MIEAGLHPTAQQVAANEKMLAAHSGQIAAHKGQIEANQRWFVRHKPVFAN
jgi:hypothetical protein